MGQDVPHEEFSRALKRYEASVAEYRHRVESSGDPDELDQLHASAVTPALEEFERLATRSMDEEKYRGFVKQLRRCHEESVASLYELRHPSKSRIAEEYRKLAEKAKALAANCHEIRLALRKYRKDLAM